MDPAHCRLNLFQYNQTMADGVRTTCKERSGLTFDPWADLASIIATLANLRGRRDHNKATGAIEAVLNKATADLTWTDRHATSDRTFPRALPRKRMAAMTTTKTYTAVYERDVADDAWNVRIKGVPGCQTYGRSIRQAQQRIRGCTRTASSSSKPRRRATPPTDLPRTRPSFDRCPCRQRRRTRWRPFAQRAATCRCPADAASTDRSRCRARRPGRPTFRVTGAPLASQLASMPWRPPLIHR